MKGLPAKSSCDDTSDSYLGREPTSRPGDGEKTEAAVREAAVGLIARLGYEAMSMRQLGAQVGVQAAALYRYFPTKEDLLFTLMREHMEQLVAVWAIVRPASLDPAERLSAFVANHIRFHVERRHSTQLSNLELRSLSRERLSAILKLRSAYEKELRVILRDSHKSEDAWPDLADDFVVHHHLGF